MPRRALSSVVLVVLAARGASADPEAPVEPAPERETNTLPSPPQVDTDTDAELMKLADAEFADTIEIFDERPDKPFDRDTDVRLTGEQLAARGATDLGSALTMLTDVIVRDGGRGGTNLDIRGGRKGSVTVLVDGVSVTDPYYGTFDVGSIPITDIVQIRVSTNPQSPIDGFGGNGGVIEVVTRDAVGPQVVIGRLTSDSLFGFGMTGTARVPLATKLALRISASGLLSQRDLPLRGGSTVDEDKHSSTGAARLEYRDGDRRFVLDGFLDNRHYVVPPGAEQNSMINVIDRETSSRVQAKYDDKLGKLQLQAQGWAHRLARRTKGFATARYDSLDSDEDLVATRVGGLVLATHPLGKSWRLASSVSIDRDAADVTVTKYALGEARTGVSVGDVTVLEAAIDLQYERKAFRADLAGGVAVPFGLAADPWPEVKGVARYKPVAHLELVGTGGYKGRVPTLRERLDSETGNPDLLPEKAWHAELRVIEQLTDRLRIEIAPYARRTSGTIRQFNNADGTREQRNLEAVRIIGVDSTARVRLHRMVEVGGSFNYLRARADSADPVIAMTPLDRLPAYRGDAWVQAQPDRRIAVLVRARYFGQSVDQGDTLPANTLLEATLTAPLSKEYLAVLRAEDTLDTRPETRNGVRAIGRVISLMLQGTWE